MAKWRDLWRRISEEAEEARSVMLRDRLKGEVRFEALIEEHGEDGMILLNRGKAYELIKEFPLAYADYLRSENAFPAEDWKARARNAAAKLEARLPSRVVDRRLKSGLEELSLRPEVRKFAEDAFQLADLSPQASIDFAHTALFELLRELGVSNPGNPRESAAANYIERPIDDLEKAGKISEVTSAEMHAIRKIRNAVLRRHKPATSHDARACAFLLMAVFRAVNQSKKSEPPARDRS